ncbi:MAG TPA: zinc-ribbon domain-containing protein [Phycisphaerae bacterium]|nr:zinc-ribbon domain-containing protein [Phycisphaerae bacterium]
MAVECPRCKARLKISDASGPPAQIRCGKCGHVFSAARPQDPPQDPPKTVQEAPGPIQALATATRGVPPPERKGGRGIAKIECPQCGATDAQKVSLVWESGTSNTSSSTLGAAFDGDGNLMPFLAGSSGKHQTQLAARLAPPEPQKDSSTLLVIVGIGFGAIAVTFGITAYGEVVGLCVFWPVGMLILAGGIVLAVRAKRQAKAYNATVFRPAMARWNASWICLRCGEKFVPGKTSDLGSDR